MEKANRTHTWMISFGGVLAALAIVIMMWGTLIPGTGCLCPLICLILADVVLQYCGMKFTWMWFAVVAFLSMLLSSDKEAAVVFLFLGDYPMVKTQLEKKRYSLAWKILFFNVMLGSIVCVTIVFLGTGFSQDQMTVYQILFFVFVFVLGNIILYLTDKFLNRVLTIIRA